ncbi:MAG: glycoside hydrolase family 97 C-terminal domain-containing protein, partial [Verrucomicrobiae bacterium]|nr:glycoside hydrolase family 97 C-terminal domain-containing protein [Verrucomicrobiae bacterium]
GRIGEYAVIARRKGREWFIGGMNSGGARSLQVPLDFLEPGRTYEARIYLDDPTLPTRTHVRIDHCHVTAATELTMVMSRQGGQAIRLIPLTE